MDYSLLLLLLTLISGLVILAVRLWSGRHPDAVLSLPARYAVDLCHSLFPVFLVVFLIRSFVAEPFRIPSSSMLPTLRTGDFILVNKFDYGLRMPLFNKRLMNNGGKPERGDVVVFRYPNDPSVPFVKRVVAVAGDRVQYWQKRLYVNGEYARQLEISLWEENDQANGSLMLEEALFEHTHRILISQRGPFRPALDITVPAGHYFVLGDNRDNSRDSRSWGFVPDDNLIGHVFMIWFSWDGGPRWNRLRKIP